MWILIMILMLILGCGTSIAQQTVDQESPVESSVNRQLNHKIKMIGHILSTESLNEKVQSIKWGCYSERSGK